MLKNMDAEYCTHDDNVADNDELDDIVDAHMEDRDDMDDGVDSNSQSMVDREEVDACVEAWVTDCEDVDYVGLGVWWQYICIRIRTRDFCTVRIRLYYFSSNAGNDTIRNEDYNIDGD